MEEWLDIKYFEGIYKVSSYGRVKSCARVITKTVRGKKMVVHLKEKILSKTEDNDGYKIVGLHKDGKRYGYKVHRLVATAFIPNPLNLPEVNHRSENKGDNRVENLEWCDRTYNNNFGTIKERLSKTMTNGPSSKKVAQYSETGELIAIFPSACEVQRQLGYSNTYISAACRGKYEKAYNYIWRYI